MGNKVTSLISSTAALKWLLGVTLTGLSTVSGFVMKRLFGAAKAKIQQFEDGITAINNKVDLAVNNHLHTIQDNTAETNRILTDMSKSQAELVGYLKAKAEDGKI